MKDDKTSSTKKKGSYKKNLKAKNIKRHRVYTFAQSTNTTKRKQIKMKN